VRVDRECAGGSNYDIDVTGIGVFHMNGVTPAAPTIIWRVTMRNEVSGYLKILRGRAANAFEALAAAELELEASGYDSADFTVSEVVREGFSR
jgi:hypothetical protein